MKALIALIVAQAALQAEPPQGYYDLAQGKSGADLRAALHTIVRGQHALPYSDPSRTDTADALGVLDQDPGDTNNLIAIYSGYSIPKTNIGSNAAGTWNREHLWPQSYGTRNGPAERDLHHMRPELASVNDSRSNNYYDVSDPARRGYAAFTNLAAGLVWSRTSTTWEPPDKVKGDIARALFYMAVRYTGDAANERRLVLTDNTSDITTNNTAMGTYTTLLKWHFADPVSAAENARNDGVAAFQGNRNPFIDHPEWVAAAFIPRVSIARTGTYVTLCWTNDYSPRLVSVQSTNLGSGWLPTTTTAVLTSTNTWAITFPVEPGARFYRVRLE